MKPYTPVHVTRELKDQKILIGLIYIFLILFSLITLIPFVWLICGALKTGEDFFAFLFLPVGNGFLGIDWARLSFDNIIKLFTEVGFFRHIINSIFYASCTSIFATLFCCMCGYALAKFQFRGQSFFTSLVLAALIIPAPLLLAPGYQLLYELHLLNTYFGLIIPGLAPAFGVFLFRQAMLNSIPRDLLESARIDGCGELRLFFTIVMPLVRPMVGAFLLISFLNAWNNFIQPQIVLQSPEKYPLAVAIAHLKGFYATDYGLITAGTLVSIAPVMILFLLLQKEYITGLTSGAVKG